MNFDDQNFVNNPASTYSKKNFDSKHNTNISIRTTTFQTETTTNVDKRQYKIIPLDSEIVQKIKESTKNQWPVKNLAFSDKVTPEYIQKLKNTNQCQRMIIQI